MGEKTKGVIGGEINTKGRKCSTTNRSLGYLKEPEAISPLYFYSGSSVSGYSVNYIHKNSERNISVIIKFL